MSEHQAHIHQLLEKRNPSNSFFRNRGPRIRATLFAASVDFAALLTAVVLGAFFRFGLDENDMLLSFLPFLITVYYSAAVFFGVYSTESFLERRKFVASSVSTLTYGFLFIFVAFFSLQLGLHFSRVFLLLTMPLSLIAVGVFRYFAWQQLRLILGQSTYAELHIADGIDLDAPNDATFLDARLTGLNPDPSDRACVERLAELGSHFDRIIVHCSAADRMRWTVMLKCLAIRGEVRIPDLDDIRPLGVVTRDGKVSAVVSEHPLEWHQALAKRIFDICVTLAAMPIILPVIAATAIAIKLDSPGPVFFRQIRIGLGNRHFPMLKFRSMRIDLQDDAASKLTERGDARVTRVGRFIRATSIDELPQFLNVLVGDMSIVGPRPHALMALAGEKLYWEVNQKYWHRHVAKPGITGLAQVRGFRGNTFEESDLQNRLNSDLEYIANWSLLQDIEIVFSTLRVLKHDRAF